LLYVTTQGDQYYWQQLLLVAVNPFNATQAGMCAEISAHAVADLSSRGKPVFSLTGSSLQVSNSAFTANPVTVTIDAMAFPGNGMPWHEQTT
jgi:hypothetical protein